MTNPATITPGVIIQSWCSVCRRSTPHIWRPASKVPLTCLNCKPEEKKESEK